MEKVRPNVSAREKFQTSNPRHHDPPTYWREDTVGGIVAKVRKGGRSGTIQKKESN